MGLKACWVAFGREGLYAAAMMRGQLAFFGPEHFLVSLPVMAVLGLVMLRVQLRGLTPLTRVAAPALAAAALLYSLVAHPPAIEVPPLLPQWRAVRLHRERMQDPGRTRQALRDRARDEVLRESFLYSAEAESGRGEMPGRMVDPTLQAVSTESPSGAKGG